MRRRSVALAVALLPLCAAVARSQEPPPTPRDTALARRSLPRDVATEATTLFNQPAALRATSRLEIEAGHDVLGDVAVLNGPLFVAGHVTGRVVAVNSDVILQQGARIDGDLLVIGGEVEGRERAQIGGELRIYRQTLRYRQEGDRLVALRDTVFEEKEAWWRRLDRRRSTDRNWSKLQIATAGAYNRVEGLPINLGPQLNRKYDWGSTRLDGYAIMRTGSSFSSQDNDVGHNVRADVRVGAWSGIALGGRLFNVVDAVEPWQLTDMEVGLASFLAHRDYRDYFQRHGASGSVSVFAWRDVSLTASFGEERWRTRIEHDPFTLFRNETAWRANPAMDDGVMHLTNGTFTVDTRSSDLNPWAGWFIVADWERGVGSLSRASLVIPPGGTTVGTTLAPAARVDYARGFLDLRRYNRLSPNAQLNFRVVAGGWLNGDPLPLERRVSVDGPGAMPGYGFRVATDGVDVGTCSSGQADPGRPALCDRIALGQVEYRGDMHLDFGRGWDWWNDDARESGDRDARAHARHFHRDGAWVLFFDAGRGWLVSSPDPSGALTYRRSELPPLSSFRSDLGGGVDFGGFGVYVAKAVSSAGEPLRFFVRLKHRF